MYNGYEKIVYIIIYYPYSRNLQISHAFIVHCGLIMLYPLIIYVMSAALIMDEQYRSSCIPQSGCTR